MKKMPFIKVLTLSGFVVLIALFLLYRTGHLEDYMPDKKVQAKADSTKLKTTDTGRVAEKDSMELLMMSSSKSIIITDPPKRAADSNKVEQIEQ
jgi:hypothetical protein